uniref:Uncharacterized protein n=1 Tax=Cacopsylla melanoneura TaxID=428564 RepID=A0A8D9E819_9HEMI
MNGDHNINNQISASCQMVDFSKKKKKFPDKFFSLKSLHTHTVSPPFFFVLPRSFLPLTCMFCTIFPMQLSSLLSSHKRLFLIISFLTSSVDREITFRPNLPASVLLFMIRPFVSYRPRATSSLS